jgi:hypothetical protein
LDDEVLGWADSLAFPIFGSVALLGLWALLKYVGKEWINFFLGLYCECGSWHVDWPKLTDSLGSGHLCVPVGQFQPTVYDGFN